MRAERAAVRARALLGWRWLVARLWRNRVGMIGAALVVAIVAVTLAAPLLARVPPSRMNIPERLSGPSLQHLLGTDNFGRDNLSRILYGYRTTLRVAVISVALALAVGGLIGLVAAWFGGLFDSVLMRVMDVFLAFPIVLLAITIMAILGPTSTNAMIAIALVYTPIFARLARGPALAVKPLEFIQAAQALGATTPRILFRHVLPQVTAPLIVQTTLSLSTAVLVEASLAFLGLGTQPPEPSLGLMLSTGRAFMEQSAWTSITSGLAIFLLVAGLNLLGDGLRDIFDPRLSQERIG
jgi:peptide/nickel transport system permease protein